MKAWPLLIYAIRTGRLGVDLDLLLVKDLDGFGPCGGVAETPSTSPTPVQIAARLGWSRRWIYDVLHECLPLLLAWHGASIAEPHRR